VFRDSYFSLDLPVDAFALQIRAGDEDQEYSLGCLYLDQLALLCNSEENQAIVSSTLEAGQEITVQAHCERDAAGRLILDGYELPIVRSLSLTYRETQMRRRARLMVLSAWHQFINGLLMPPNNSREAPWYKGNRAWPTLAFSVLAAVILAFLSILLIDIYPKKVIERDTVKTPDKPALPVEHTANPSPEGSKTAQAGNNRDDLSNHNPPPVPSTTGSSRTSPRPLKTPTDLDLAETELLLPPEINRMIQRIRDDNR